jgi:hypothetical protein
VAELRTSFQDCLLLQATALAADKHLFKAETQLITALTEPAEALVATELVVAVAQVVAVETEAAVAL